MRNLEVHVNVGLLVNNFKYIGKTSNLAQNFWIPLTVDILPHLLYHSSIIMINSFKIILQQYTPLLLFQCAFPQNKNIRSNNHCSIIQILLTVLMIFYGIFFLIQNPILDQALHLVFIYL